MAESTDLFIFTWDVLMPRAMPKRGALSKSHVRILDMPDDLSKEAILAILPDLQDKEVAELAMALLVLKTTKEIPSFNEAAHIIDIVMKLIDSIPQLEKNIVSKYSGSLLSQINSTDNEDLLK